MYCKIQFFKQTNQQLSWFVALLHFPCDVKLRYFQRRYNRFDSAEIFSNLKYQRALSTYTTYSACDPQLNARSLDTHSGGCQQSFWERHKIINSGRERRGEEEEGASKCKVRLRRCRITPRMHCSSGTDKCKNASV